MQDASEVIMIVDDDPLIRAMCKSAFEDKGYFVLEADNGERAVTLLSSHQVDFVFLDVLMPDKDGLEALLEIKRTQPAAYVFAMSGGGRRGHYGYLEIAKRFGADEIVKKPFSPSAIVDLVGAHLAQLAAKSVAG
jgi:CheY-like chemotaxis protein